MAKTVIAEPKIVEINRFLTVNIANSKSVELKVDLFAPEENEYIIIMHNKQEVATLRNTLNRWLEMNRREEARNAKTK